VNILRRLRQNERGFALIMALGALTVLSFVIVSAVEYTSSNSRQAYASKSSQSAYTLAEAGLNNALSIIYNTTTPAYTGLLPQTTDYYDENMSRVARTTANYNTWSGTLDTSVPQTQCTGHAACWIVTSTGYVRNPAGGSKPETRQLTIKVGVDPVFTQPLVNPAYDYVFVYGTGAPSGCDFNASNSSSFTSALYVQGNLCLSNSAVVAEELHVWGAVTTNSPQAGIGTSSNYDTKGVHVKGGCRYSTNGTGSYNSPCGTGDHVWANPAADASPRTLTPPTIAWTSWYKLASPGPYSACQTSSGTPNNTSNWATAFDGDQGTAPDPTKMNRSVPSTFNLTPTSSYSCKTAFGELSYDASNHVLTVKGTVFIDGNARVDPGSGVSVIRYTGVGSLYLSGSFVLKGTSLCAAVSGNTCDWSLPGSGHWDVANNFLNIVAGGIGGGGQNDTAASDVSVELIRAGLQSEVTAAQRVDVSAQSSFQGPLVESSLTLGQSLTTYPFGTLTNVPTATPGNNVSAYTVSSPSGYGG
jgi:Tfp pilus assembly protein PilX